MASVWLKVKPRGLLCFHLRLRKRKKAITVEAGHHQRFPPDAANHLHGTENKIISD